MDMSKNVIIGIIVAALLAVLFAAYYFFFSNDDFKKFNFYSIKYDNVSNLSKGAGVFYRGLRVGKVKRIYITDNSNQVTVDLKVHKKYSIPKNAEALIVSGGLVSGNIIHLKFDSPCQGNNCAESGDELKGRKGGFLDKEAYASKTKDALTDIGNSVKERYTAEENDELIGKTLRDINYLNQKLTSLQNEMGGIASSSKNQYNAIMADVNAINQEVNKHGKIKQLTADLNTLSKSFSNIDIKNIQNRATLTMKEANELKNNSNTSMKDLQATMTKAKDVYNDLKDVMNQMKSEDGSMAYLMDKEGFTKDMNTTMAQLNQLSKNLEEKPYLYIPFKRRKKFCKKNPDKCNQQ